NGDGSGSFTGANATIPSNAHVGQGVVSGHGATSDMVASATFTVVYTATIEVSPSDVMPGGSLELSAAGFAPNEFVDIYWGEPVTTTIGMATTNGTGAFPSRPLPVPPDAQPGTDVTVHAVGRTSGAVATAMVHVIPAPYAD